MNTTELIMKSPIFKCDACILRIQLWLVYHIKEM